MPDSIKPWLCELGNCVDGVWLFGVVLFSSSNPEVDESSTPKLSCSAYHHAITRLKTPYTYQ